MTDDDSSELQPGDAFVRNLHPNAYLNPTVCMMVTGVHLLGAVRAVVRRVRRRNEIRALERIAVLPHAARGAPVPHPLPTI